MAKANILVVEDDGIVAKGIKHNLENLGFTVSATVPSGEETLDKVKEENPDLVLKGSSRNRFPLHLLPRN